MFFWKDPTIGLEQELIIVDKNGNPVNKIKWQIASQLVLNLIFEEYPDLIKKWLVKPELDACQIELVTRPGKPENVKDELIDIYKAVKKVVEKNLGLKLSWWVPNQDFDPVCSGSEYYNNIHNFLMMQGIEYRKATNIAGLHLHIEDEAFKRFVSLSNKVRKAILDGRLDKVLLSKERFDKMQLVVEALVKRWLLDKENPFANTIIPYWFKSTDEVRKLVFNWGWIIKNYNLVWIKRPGNKYTTEIRTPDSIAPDNYRDLIKFIDEVFSRFLE